MKLSALVEFMRPHTIINTTLAPICIGVAYKASVSSFMASTLGKSPMTVGVDWDFWLRGVAAIYASFLFANIFIVGINQIYDIDIDKINKPYLPLASGEMTVSQAWIINIFSLVASLALALFFGTPQVVLLMLALNVIGCIYTIPPFSTRRQFFTAAASIVVCRGFILPFTVYKHLNYVTGVPADAPTWKPLVFLLMFTIPWSAVVALFKDIPDIQGDKEHEVNTLSVRLGARRVYYLCLAIMAVTYLSSAVAISYLLDGRFIAQAVYAFWYGYVPFVTVPAVMHSAVEKKQDMIGFYMIIWKLFYAQYALFIFM